MSSIPMHFLCKSALFSSSTAPCTQSYIHWFLLLCQIFIFFMIHWREYLGLRSWHQFQTFHRHNLVFAERSLGCGQCGHMQQFRDEFMHLRPCKWWAGQIKVECNGHVMGVRQRRVLTFAWKRPRCGFYPTACIPANTTLSKLSTHIILSILSVPTDTALNYQYFCSNNTGVIQDIWHIGWSCGYIGQTVGLVRL